MYTITFMHLGILLWESTHMFRYTCQGLSNVEGASVESRVLYPYKCNNVCVYMCSKP